MVREVCRNTLLFRWNRTLSMVPLLLMIGATGWAKDVSGTSEQMPSIEQGTETVSCAGDCDGGDVVTVDELITLVGIALGTAQPSACAERCSERRRQVDIALILKAVKHSLTGCPLVVRLSDGDLQGDFDGGSRRFLGIPYAAPPVGDLRWRPPQAAGAVGWHTAGQRLRTVVLRLRAVHQSAVVFGRLPVLERVDAQPGAGRPAAGDGVVPRRRQSDCLMHPPSLQPQGRAAAIQRSHARRDAQRHRRHHQLPARRVWLLQPPRIGGRGSGVSVRGQSGSARSARGAAVGPRQHRRLRRRSRQRHHLRRIGRFLRRVLTRGIAGQRRSLPSRHQREQRMHYPSGQPPRMPRPP